MALDEDGASRRFDPCGDERGSCLQRGLLQLLRVVKHRDSVEIYDAEESFVGRIVGNINPLFQGTEIIAEVQIAGGLHTRENAVTVRRVVAEWRAQTSCGTMQPTQSGAMTYESICCGGRSAHRAEKSWPASGYHSHCMCAVCSMQNAESLRKIKQALPRTQIRTKVRTTCIQCRIPIGAPTDRSTDLFENGSFGLTRGATRTAASTSA